MSVGLPPPTDWLKQLLFDRGYLASLKGEAIKVYLVLLDASGGRPDSSVTMSLSQLTTRTRLTCPTIIDSLERLEKLGLVVSTNRRRGKATTYYVPDPLRAASRED